MARAAERVFSQSRKSSSANRSNRRRDSSTPSQIYIHGATKLESNSTQLLLAEILTEVRGCREDIKEQAEKISALEATTYPALKNNGQPSRLSAVETRVTDLERGHWRLAGLLAGISLFASTLLTVSIEYVKTRLGH